MELTNLENSRFKMTEKQIQDAVKQFADMYLLPFIHVPNEGVRTKWQGYQLKKAGMMTGVADCFFMRGNDNYKGLWIELKVPPNKPTQAQESFLMLANSEGYLGIVCYSLDSALAEIRAFYDLE